MARITFKEVEEVARLASAQRLTSFGSGPTTYGLADALGLPPDEIERLLDQARRLKTAAADDGASRRPLMVAGAVVAALALVLFKALQFVGPHPGRLATTPRPTPESVPAFRTSAPMGVASAAQPLPLGASGTSMPIGSSATGKMRVEAPPAEAKTSESDLRNAQERARAAYGDPRFANDPSRRPEIAQVDVQAAVAK